MKFRALALAIVAAVPLPALAQTAPAPGTQSGPTTCAQFTAMASTDQVAALSSIEPLGGELDSSDPTITAQWAAAVTSACEGHPDRALSDAAAEALGGD
jgi:hypothetical protein